MNILVIISGEYGLRHLKNIQDNGPSSWVIHTWKAPTIFPLIIDYPEDYLPEQLPQTDLILSFAEHKGVGELLPEIAKMTNAKAVVAAIDNESWLPRGLARQVRGWLEQMDVVCATPKPLCSLTENSYWIKLKETIQFDSPHIAEFARYFGKPELKIEVDPNTRTITKTEVKRDAVCGCARYVAEKLIGISADDAEEKAGLLHHHFPCLASMVKDPDFNMDTLMHASGNLLKKDVGQQVKPFKKIGYIKPGITEE